MKEILIRSLRVICVLALISACIKLIIYNSVWFVAQLLVLLLFLDSMDSMLVWRLKRITSRYMPLVWSYLIVAALAFSLCCYTGFCIVKLDLHHSYGMLVMFAGLITIFSFRYFCIMVEIMMRHE